jgi:hypothetical protein
MNTCNKKLNNWPIGENSPNLVPLLCRLVSESHSLNNRVTAAGNGGLYETFLSIN